VEEVARQAEEVMEEVVKRRWGAMAGAVVATRVQTPLPSGSAILSKVSLADQVLGRSLGTSVFMKLREKGVSAMVVLGILTVAMAMPIQYVELTHHSIHAKVDTRIVS
jgi:hypothetical protein